MNKACNVWFNLLTPSFKYEFASAEQEPWNK